MDDFQPDILVKKGYERDVEVVEFSKRLEKCTLYESVQIKKGCIGDYYKLSRFHYRSKSHEESEGLRARDCFRLLFNGELIGVIVYSRSYLNLASKHGFWEKVCFHSERHLHGKAD